MVNIGRATAADEADVRGLLRFLLTETLIDGNPVDESESASAAYQAMLAGDRGEVLIAEDTRGFLGCITFSCNLAIRYGGECAQVEELIVNEAARGKQVGASLVQAAIETARQRGCKEIGLYAREENARFYEKQGFRYVAPELRRRLD